MAHIYLYPLPIRCLVGVPALTALLVPLEGYAVGLPLVLWRDTGRCSSRRLPAPLKRSWLMAHVEQNRKAKDPGIVSGAFFDTNYSGPSGIRTLDTRIKSPLLCQTELTAPVSEAG